MRKGGRNVKQGTTLKLPVKFTGIDLDKVSSIEFIFTQHDFIGAPVLKEALWVKDDENETAFRSTTMQNAILIPWTSGDTYAFEQKRNFFLDTKIHISGTEDNPATPIIALKMTPTLFEEGQVANDGFG